MSLGIPPMKISPIKKYSPEVSIPVPVRLAENAVFYFVISKNHRHTGMAVTGPADVEKFSSWL